MKIISIANRKGGVGKTTTTINIATALSAIEKKVLVIDFDPQGNATTSMGIAKQKGQYSSYDVLINNCDVRDAIIHTDLPRFDMIPSSPDLAAAEIELVDVEKREYVLRKALRNLDSLYDYVLIDCPPSLNLITINALVCSNSVMVPLQCEFLALEGITQLMYSIKLVKKHLNEAISIEGIVLTMKNARSTLYTSVSENLKKYFKVLIVIFFVFKKRKCKKDN